jgi:hypothetical protein
MDLGSDRISGLVSGLINLQFYDLDIEVTGFGCKYKGVHGALYSIMQGDDLKEKIIFY